jgi:uncharacterized protein
MHPHIESNVAIRRTLMVVALVTIAVGLIARVAPESWSATAVGLVFLGTTYSLSVSRASSASVRATGLSLGGLLETDSVDFIRMAHDTLRAIAFTLGAVLLIFPLFWCGFVVWWHPTHAFVFRSPVSWGDELLGQALVVALPEEAFYRGYLLTNLERGSGRHARLIGVSVSMSLVWSSALFAVGHYVTEPSLSRLAVFFPALVFGWLRWRTGGIGASVLFHVLCNAFASFLGRGYGLWQ